MVVLVAVAATALALAACAQEEAAMAGSVAAEAAEVAATQAAIATTQAIQKLENSTTRMASASPRYVSGPRALPSLLPKTHKGNMVIITPDFVIVQKDGRRLIVPRDRYVKEEEDQARQ
jgi:hypothetical protein